MRCQSAWSSLTERRPSEQCEVLQALVRDILDLRLVQRLIALL
jgi:hypothetical protein